MFGMLGLGLRETVRFTRVEERYQALEPELRIYRRIQ
jgi:hypothetical protein